MITPVRRQILTLAAQGLTSAQIARRLGRSELTILDHLRRIYELLGACDRTHAVVLAHQRGLISLDPPASQEGEGA